MSSMAYTIYMCLLCERGTYGQTKRPQVRAYNEDGEDREISDLFQHMIDKHSYNAHKLIESLFRKTARS